MPKSKYKSKHCYRIPTLEHQAMSKKRANPQSKTMNLAVIIKTCSVSQLVL